MQATIRTPTWTRVEDVVLAGWMVLVVPVLGRVQNSVGPFDAGRVLDGAFGLVGVIGAIACLVTTSSDRPADEGPNILERAVIGPLIGGLILVATSAVDGLNLPPVAASMLIALTVAMVVVLRLRRPTLPTQVRRALITPFTLVAGTLFSTLIHQITDGSALSGSLARVDLGVLAVVLAFVALFAAVFFTMLVYAPRQVAEREGSPRTWVLRYLLFVAATLVGLIWLALSGA